MCCNRENDLILIMTPEKQDKGQTSVGERRTSHIVHSTKQWKFPVCFEGILIHLTLK